MRAFEAWERVNAKRQEHQTTAGLQATAGATRADHERAGQEWIDAFCREHRLDFEDVVETILAAQRITVPNLRALTAIGALHPRDLPEAAFGGGFMNGLAVGLELCGSRSPGG